MPPTEVIEILDDDSDDYAPKPVNNKRKRLEPRKHVKMEPQHEEAKAPTVPEDPQDSSCPICFEDIEPETHAKTLPCLHSLCLSCLTSWAGRKRACALCRTPVLGYIHDIKSDMEFKEVTFPPEAPPLVMNGVPIPQVHAAAARLSAVFAEPHGLDHHLVVLQQALQRLRGHEALAQHRPGVGAGEPASSGLHRSGRDASRRHVAGAYDRDNSPVSNARAAAAFAAVNGLARARDRPQDSTRHVIDVSMDGDDDEDDDGVSSAVLADYARHAPRPRFSAAEQDVHRSRRGCAQHEGPDQLPAAVRSRLQNVLGSGSGSGSVPASGINRQPSPYYLRLQRGVMSGMAARLGQQAAAPQLHPLSGAAQQPGAAGAYAPGSASAHGQPAAVEAPAAVGSFPSSQAVVRGTDLGRLGLPTLSQALARGAGHDPVVGSGSGSGGSSQHQVLWDGAAWPTRRRPSWLDDHTAVGPNALAIRRAVYDDCKWAYPHGQGLPGATSSSGGGSGGSSNNTAAREAAAAGNRHLPAWIERELKAVLNDEDVGIVQAFVLGLVRSYGLPAPVAPTTTPHMPPPGAAGSSSAGRDTAPRELCQFLFEKADHFWHELRCFAHAGLSIQAYDQCVQYHAWWPGSSNLARPNAVPAPPPPPSVVDPFDDALLAAAWPVDNHAFAVPGGQHIWGRPSAPTSLAGPSGAVPASGVNMHQPHHLGSVWDDANAIFDRRHRLRQSPSVRRNVADGQGVRSGPSNEGLVQVPQVNTSTSLRSMRVRGWDVAAPLPQQQQQEDVGGRVLQGDERWLVRDISQAQQQQPAAAGAAAGDQSVQQQQQGNRRAFVGRRRIQQAVAIPDSSPGMGADVAPESAALQLGRHPGPPPAGSGDDHVPGAGPGDAAAAVTGRKWRVVSDRAGPMQGPPQFSLPVRYVTELANSPSHLAEVADPAAGDAASPADDASRQGGDRTLSIVPNDVTGLTGSDRSDGHRHNSSRSRSADIPPRVGSSSRDAALRQPESPPDLRWSRDAAAAPRDQHAGVVGPGTGDEHNLRWALPGMRGGVVGVADHHLQESARTVLRALRNSRPLGAEAFDMQNKSSRRLVTAHASGVVREHDDDDNEDDHWEMDQ